MTRERQGKKQKNKGYRKEKNNRGIGDEGWKGMESVNYERLHWERGKERRRKM